MAGFTETMQSLAPLLVALFGDENQQRFLYQSQRDAENRRRYEQERADLMRQREFDIAGRYGVNPYASLEGPLDPQQQMASELAAAVSERIRQAHEAELMERAASLAVAGIDPSSQASLSPLGEGLGEFGERAELTTRGLESELQTKELDRANIRSMMSTRATPEQQALLETLTRGAVQAGVVPPPGGRLSDMTDLINQRLAEMREAELADAGVRRRLAEAQTGEVTARTELHRREKTQDDALEELTALRVKVARTQAEIAAAVKRNDQATAQAKQQLLERLQAEAALVMARAGMSPGTNPLAPETGGGFLGDQEGF